jgi:KTSC domain
MRVTAVESSTLATVAYDATRELLQLGFCSGAVYQYFGVPAAVYQALLDAPSKGGYFNHAIRGQFAYRLNPDCDAIAPDAAVPAGCDC